MLTLGIWQQDTLSGWHRASPAARPASPSLGSSAGSYEGCRNCERHLDCPENTPAHTNTRKCRFFSSANCADILFPNVHKKIFFSFTPKCVFVSPSQWWCVQERERAARKSTAVFLHAKLLQKQLPWEALNWTAFPRQRGRKDPRLLTSACVLMRFSCYTNRLFDLSYRFHVFSLSFFSLYHFIPLHFNVFSTRSSPHHPTPSLLSFTVPLFHLLPLSLFVSILFLLSFLLSCITTTPFSQPICPQSHDHTPALQKGPCLRTATIGCSPLCGCESPNWASLWAGLWGSIFAWSRKPLTLN